ncbi:MAG: CRISPR-associated endonuclease Cas2 [Methanobacteriaceae archaeon]|nr:CRISPR-associated endonuclease Cas2 [Methanobacteriaceae archaeon]
MYVLIVYDIKVNRVNKVKAFLRQHLYWVQNSVFEGELSKSQYQKVNSGLKKIIKKDEDSIIIYKFPFDNPNKEILGIEKAPIDEIL